MADKEPAVKAAKPIQLQEGKSNTIEAIKSLKAYLSPTFYIPPDELDTGRILNNIELIRKVIQENPLPEDVLVPAIELTQEQAAEIDSIRENTENLFEQAEADAAADELENSYLEEATRNHSAALAINNMNA